VRRGDLEPSVEDGSWQPGYDLRRGKEGFGKRGQVFEGEGPGTVCFDIGERIWNRRGSWTGLSGRFVEARRRFRNWVEKQTGVGGGEETDHRDLYGVGAEDSRIE